LKNLGWSWWYRQGGLSFIFTLYIEVGLYLNTQQHTPTHSKKTKEDLLVKAPFAFSATYYNGKARRF
jgi:hypothetical protein